MTPTFALFSLSPMEIIILLGIGALSCLALKGGKPAQPPVPEEAEKAAPTRAA